MHIDDLKVSPLDLPCLEQNERILKWDLRYLRMIKNEICTWSKDPSTQVGSVIVRDTNKFVSLGYNGYASSDEDDTSLDNREEKYERVIHAEINAILFSKRDLTGCTLYVWPLAPCSRCAGPIAQVGIKRVVSVTPVASVQEKWIKSMQHTYKIFKNAGIDFVLYPNSILCINKPGGNE
jgi:dCMP deaminase